MRLRSGSSSTSPGVSYLLSAGMFSDMDSPSVYTGYAGALVQLAQEIEDAGGWEEEPLLKIRVELPGALEAPPECETTIDFLRETFCARSRQVVRGAPRCVVHAAARDHAPSLFCLGLLLALAGEDSADSMRRADLTDDALWLFSLAAELGDARAQWAMGERFSRMRFGLEEGVRLLGKAAP